MGNLGSNCAGLGMRLKVSHMKAGAGAARGRGHPSPLSFRHAGEHGDGGGDGDGGQARRRQRPKTPAPGRAKEAFSWVHPSNKLVTAVWKLFHGALKSYGRVTFLFGRHKHRIEVVPSGNS